MAFQRARVKKALGSVPQTCRNGRRVAVDTDGSYVSNQGIRGKLWLKEQDGVFVLPVMVGPPSDLDWHKPGLGRQAR